MRRSFFIAVLGSLILCGSASARVFTPPTEFDHGYSFTENPDGTFTEYYRDTVPGAEIIKGDTYSGDAIREADRVSAQVGVDMGTTGQDGSIVQGATLDNQAGAMNVVEDFRTTEWYKTAGEANVGDALTTEAVTEGTLPTFAEMAGAASGAVFSAGAVVAAGVALGDGIDAVLGFPYVNPFAGGDTTTADTCGTGCSNLKQYWRYSPDIEFGEVRPCENTGGPLNATYPEPGKNPEPPGEVCDFPTMTYNHEDFYTYLGEFEENEPYEAALSYESGPSNRKHFTAVPPCPVSWVKCSELGEASEYVTKVLYFGLFAPGVEGHWLGFPTSGLGPHNGSKVGTLAPMKPVEELPIHPPAKVDAPVKHKIIEKAKKHKTKKEEEEEEKGKHPIPGPLIPPVETPEPGTPEIPNPSNPIVPQYTPTELAPDYAKKVEAAGFTAPEVKHVPDGEADPRKGPNTVVSADPAPGTSSPPDTKVKIRANPEDSPPAEGGGAIGGPTEPGLKFPEFPILCKGFPFGVPCWLAKTIESWSTTAVAPVWGFDFNIKEHNIKGSFDFAKLEPVMEKVRAAIVIFATIGLVLLFYSFAKGGGPPSGSGGSGGDGQSYAEEQGEFMSGG